MKPIQTKCLSGAHRSVEVIRVVQQLALSHQDLLQLFPEGWPVCFNPIAVGYRVRAPKQFIRFFQVINVYEWHVVSC
jgi:hypothetical protein